MPRNARKRILYNECYAHVYSRALEKKTIFREASDFEFFWKLIWKTKQNASYRLHHYCLMHTHFHMAVSIHDLKLFSEALKEIKESYAKRFRTKYGTVGPLWWGRFGSQVIENEAYMHACGLYIEMNPVKAGMVKRATDWPYSSSRYYFLNQADPLVDRYKQPKADVAKKLMEGLNIQRGSYLGSPLFILNRGQRS